MVFLRARRDLISLQYFRHFCWIYFILTLHFLYMKFLPVTLLVVLLVLLALLVLSDLIRYHEPLLRAWFGQL